VSGREVILKEPSTASPRTASSRAASSSRARKRAGPLEGGTVLVPPTRRGADQARGPAAARTASRVAGSGLGAILSQHADSWLVHSASPSLRCPIASRPSPVTSAWEASTASSRPSRGHRRRRVSDADRGPGRRRPQDGDGGGRAPTRGDGKVRAWPRVTVSRDGREGLNFIDALDTAGGRSRCRFAVDADLFASAGPGDTVRSACRRSRTSGRP